MTSSLHSPPSGFGPFRSGTGRAFSAKTAGFFIPVLSIKKQLFSAELQLDGIFPGGIRRTGMLLQVPATVGR